MTGVDISADMTRVVAASKDSNCYIYDVKSKQLLDRVCFKYQPAAKNMIMRACCFRDDGTIYTLCTQPREPSFIVRWAYKDKKYQPSRTGQVHAKSSTGMRLSPDQRQLCVMTSDGFANIVDTATLQL